MTGINDVGQEGPLGKSRKVCPEIVPTTISLPHLVPTRETRCGADPQLVWPFRLERKSPTISYAARRSAR